MVKRDEGQEVESRLGKGTEGPGLGEGERRKQSRREGNRVQPRAPQSLPFCRSRSSGRSTARLSKWSAEGKVKASEKGRRSSVHGDFARLAERAEGDRK